MTSLTSSKVLLVEPNYPTPTKSKNHKNFLPIGLLKIASYLRKQGKAFLLVRGIPEGDTLDEIKKFSPQEIWISTLFTYWAPHARESAEFFRELFPSAKIIAGGIYASLLPEHCKAYLNCDEVFVGQMLEAENCLPLYDLVEPIDYQIIHTTRGCTRKCDFCGTWKIEPQFIAKDTIKGEIIKKKLVFYDNNLLANPNIESILGELAEMKKAGFLQWCDSQSGFDGRILLEKPTLACNLKSAGFRFPRIAWDGVLNKSNEIKKQIDILCNAGYKQKDISIFMLYNWDLDFEILEKKRKFCWEWQVQINDCRYRPLNQTFDNFNSRKEQMSDDYFISECWTDKQVKTFRKHVRMQNICVRHGFPFYSRAFETKKVSRELTRKIKTSKSMEEKMGLLSKHGFDYWVP